MKSEIWHELVDLEWTAGLARIISLLGLTIDPACDSQ